MTRNITQGAGIDMTEDFALFLDQVRIFNSNCFGFMIHVF